ncbi:hypothetical protein CHLRE_12g511800v5 [Chlamydomonas reinhardtii]|uniref:Uncharacterized protein n=1 Tax=Chlamydomonas reinhardtii TaxID=3055 RepID=A8IKW1_CHLRE|nr:uncharacterized protein CHLRE_12g511800v5 [Chlamydomonas reinhardtii]PNW74747.1 hypothetical protein CHLRE_12g511800v5 [Chlamydomonas reinhardtii]|eukprot:XP_001690880.1 predicted protein [Chlamydomonas reinhardtii]
MLATRSVGGSTTSSFHHLIPAQSYGLQRPRAPARLTADWPGVAPRQARPAGNGAGNDRHALTTCFAQGPGGPRDDDQKLMRIENRELLVGDVVAIINFCLYKQIAAIITSPDFPGWLAPLDFSPTRFSEFVALTVTLVGTWVAAGLMVGAYRTAATSDLPAALRVASLTWLSAMPVAAAQLVIVTAVESRSLVGDTDWGTALPLAARGVGEPFVTATGMLALMILWRCVYSLYLDPFGLKGLGFRRQQFLRDLYSFREALLMATLMCAVGSISLQVVHALDTVLSSGM